MHSVPGVLGTCQTPGTEPVKLICNGTLWVSKIDQLSDIFFSGMCQVVCHCTGQYTLIRAGYGMGTSNGNWSLNHGLHFPTRTNCANCYVPTA